MTDPPNALNIVPRTLVVTADVLGLHRGMNEGAL
jgi:hypothetical protein